MIGDHSAGLRLEAVYLAGKLSRYAPPAPGVARQATEHAKLASFMLAFSVPEANMRTPDAGFPLLQLCERAATDGTAVKPLSAHFSDPVNPACGHHLFAGMIVLTLKC